MISIASSWSGITWKSVAVETIQVRGEAADDGSVIPLVL
jgi:hypothetical protein